MAQKIVTKYKRIFTAFLLAFFVCASLFLSVHSFSHNVAQKSAVELVAKNFTASGFLVKNHKSSKHDISGCVICFSSITQNNNIVTAAIIFTIAVFYLFLIWRKFARVKLSYLSSSFLSRAPPLVS